MPEWYYLWLVYFHCYLNSLSKVYNVLDQFDYLLTWKVHTAVSTLYLTKYNC